MLVTFIKVISGNSTKAVCFLITAESKVNKHTFSTFIFYSIIITSSIILWESSKIANFNNTNSKILPSIEEMPFLTESLLRILISYHE